MLLFTVLFVFFIFNTNDAFKVSINQGNKTKESNMTWECEICLSGFSFIRFLMNDSYLRDFNMFATKKICERIPPGRSKNVVCYINYYKYL
ncbi:Saposin-like protein [Schistosoma japonicum]|nr:Saposin-like protein [Schistosoma japonicum]